MKFDPMNPDPPVTQELHTIPISELSPIRKRCTRGRSAPGWIRTFVPISESAMRPGIARRPASPRRTIEFSISQRSIRQSGPIAV